MKKQVRILAVDDDENILYMLHAIGEAADWYIDGVSDGEQALRYMKERGPYHLMLLDYHMPHMNGLQVLARVRAKNKDIPVVVLTVDEDLHTARSFLDAGATDFALKPIKAADLISRVQVHLRLAAAERKLDDNRITSEILPKGIQEQTLTAIVEEMRNAQRFVSQQYIADRTGFAYQTVCRYIQYLEEKGQIKVKLDYGKLGRPTKVVQWNDG